MSFSDSGGKRFSLPRRTGPVALVTAAAATSGTHCRRAGRTGEVARRQECAFEGADLGFELGGFALVVLVGFAFVRDRGVRSAGGEAWGGFVVVCGIQRLAVGFDAVYDGLKVGDGGGEGVGGE